MTAPPLLVRCGAFGDVVVLTTLVHLLAARYQSPVDVVGAGAWTRALLAGDPAVDRVELIASRNTPYPLCPSQWRVAHWLRQRGRGPVYMCDNHPRLLALLRRGGVPEEDIVRRPREPAGAAPRLWPDLWLEMGQQDPPASYRTVAVAAQDYRLPALTVSEAARVEFKAWRTARGLSGPLVLLQPGNKRTHKRGTLATRQHPKHWPPESWAALARAIWQSNPDAQVLLCGSPAEAEVLEEVRAAAANDPRMHNLAPDLPIPRLLALIEAAHSMVSVDTGPAHAAAALGCPLVVMFGPASPLKWRPLGPAQVIALQVDKGDDSQVRDLPAARVIDAWRSLQPRDHCGPPAEGQPGNPQ
ncbi:glycosyltransferase family 9 protein [Pseudoxanthomonas gei]|uniref:glycosyltransferase family 9 protein n=1 Tax=Pseudoxanthomonas gei TaxID=1383030 RepID=UPI001390A559